MEYEQMVMETQLTADRFTEVIRWMDGDDSGMDEANVKAFLNDMVSAFRRRFLRDHPGMPVPRFRCITSPAVSLASIVGEEKAKALACPAAPDGSLFGDEVMDSAMLLNSIGHVARSCGCTVSLSRAQLILYCIYGAWISGKGERLPVEQPQAWRYGPVFPQAHGKGRLEDPDACRESYGSLQRIRPDVAELVRRRTMSMMRTRMTDLLDVHVRSRTCPYARTARRCGVRGAPIPDEMISSFFRSAGHVAG